MRTYSLARLLLLGALGLLVVIGSILGPSPSGNIMIAAAAADAVRFALNLNDQRRRDEGREAVKWIECMSIISFACKIF